MIFHTDCSYCELNITMEEPYMFAPTFFSVKDKGQVNVFFQCHEFS